MVKKIFKIIYKIAAAVILVLVVLVCSCSIYTLVQRARGVGMPTVFGFAIASVASGSMSPTIEVGDLIVIKSGDSYSEGDIITYYEPTAGDYITHRIQYEVDGGFKTKGDYYGNSEDTYTVTYENIVGKVVLVLSGWGTVISFLQTPAGLFCLIGGLVCLWLLYKIARLLIEQPKEKK